MRIPPLIAFAAFLSLAAGNGHCTVVDSRFRVAGKAEHARTGGDGRFSVRTTVRLNGGPSFPIDTNSQAYVSDDRSRLLVAGGHFDALTFMRGGEALLYTGKGKLIKRLMTFSGPWIGPQPVVAIEPAGAVWIAADGRLSRFSRDGILACSLDIEGQPMYFNFSPSAGRLALAINTNWGPVKSEIVSRAGAQPSEPDPDLHSLLIFDTACATVTAASPSSTVHALEFVDEDHLITFSGSYWQLLRRGPGGGLTQLQQGNFAGHLLGPYSVTASTAGWFAVATEHEGSALIRVIEAATGRELQQQRYPGPVYQIFRRIITLEGDEVNVALEGRTYSFTVPARP